jgi:hypothetical protein
VAVAPAVLRLEAGRLRAPFDRRVGSEQLGTDRTARALVAGSGGNLPAAGFGTA